jgi:2Fe-2S iron-sulfur cluster binding domain
MIGIIVNGARRTVESAPDIPLLWVLRDELGLTGTRFSCGAGLCGCCIVHVDGAAMRSCSIAVGDVASRNITTIEHARRSRMPRRRPQPGSVQLARWPPTVRAILPGCASAPPSQRRPQVQARLIGQGRANLSREQTRGTRLPPGAPRTPRSPTIMRVPSRSPPINRGGRSR